MGLRAAPIGQGVRPLQYVTTGWHRWVSRRRTAILSIVGLALLAVTAPKLLPIWCFKSVTGALISHLAAVKLDTDMLAALALAGGYIKDAQQAVEKERQNTAAERDAFLDFAERVQSIPPVSQPSDGGTTAHVSNRGTGREKLERVRKQYQRTVMSAQAYEEPFPEHLSTEFGSDVATIVLDGHRFGEPVKLLLVEQARESATQRESLLDAIDAEERSLQSARKSLEPVESVLCSLEDTSLLEQSIDEIVETDADVQECQRRCNELLQTRQREIQTGTGREGRNTPFLQEFLYRNHEVRFPVLHTTLDYVNRLARGRSTLVQSLCRRA